MKKLPIVLVLSSAAICSNNMDPFEQLHQNINDQIKAFDKAFKDVFENSSAPTKSRQSSVIKQLDLQNKDNSIEIKIEFNSEPKGSIEAQKKSLKGSFEADGYKVDLNIEKNKAYKYIDGSSWVLHLEAIKKEEIKKTVEPTSNDSKSDAATETSVKTEEKIYFNTSSYSSTQTIQANLDDLKKASIEQSGNTVTIIIPKKIDSVRKITLQTPTVPAKEESTPIEIAKKADSDSKELA